MSSLKKIVDRTTAAAKKKANDAMSMQKTRCVQSPNQHCFNCLLFSGRIFPAAGPCPGVRTAMQNENCKMKNENSLRPKTSDLRPVCFVAMNGKMEFPYHVDLAGKLQPIDGQEEFWDFHLYRGCWVTTAKPQREQRKLRTAETEIKTSATSVTSAAKAVVVKGVAA